MRPLLERLSAGEILVADGAMGTMLFASGLQPGQCPEKINLDRPQLLRQIGSLYVDAGSDIISTNTFGGSPLKLAQYSLDEKTEEINAAAIRAARKAAGERACVAASIGPCGRMLEPYGDTAPEAVAEGFTRQIRVAIDEGVDALFIETMTDLSEATLAIKAARAISTTIPISATMTFDVTPRGFYTIMGVSVEQACQGLAEAGADVVGSNCGNGIENMVKLAAVFARHTSLPIIVQPNAGLPDIRGGAAVYAETPAFMAEHCHQLLDLGVRIIGGCCGTTPGHIAAIKKVVDAKVKTGK